MFGFGKSKEVAPTIESTVEHIESSEALITLAEDNGTVAGVFEHAVKTCNEGTYTEEQAVQLIMDSLEETKSYIIAEDLVSKHLKKQIELQTPEKSESVLETPVQTPEFEEVNVFASHNNAEKSSGAELTQDKEDFTEEELEMISNVNAELPEVEVKKPEVKKAA